MNSKINGVAGGSPRLDNGKQVGGAQRGSGGESKTAPAQADEVNLTDSARLLVRVAKTLEELPSIDAQRVETVKQAIADGTYAVDAQRVAAEVLRMELNLKLR